MSVSSKKIIVAALIGLLPAATASWLARETRGLLIGESASRRIVDGVRELVSSSLDFRNDAGAEEVERVVSGLDCEIKANFPRVRRVFIEARSRHG